VFGFQRIGLIIMAYAAQADLEQYAGTNNVAVVSQLDNTVSGADVTRIGVALTYASEAIDAVFRDGPFVTPLVTTTAQPLLTRWACVIAWAWLWRSRGMRDTGSDGLDKASRELGQVQREMLLYKSGVLHLDATRRWASPSAPVAQ
jgi:phage gp36-like protein